MFVDPISAVFLLLTGVVALVVGMLLYKEYTVNKKPYHLSWAVSFFVLFVSGVLIIIFDWEVLDNPIIPVVAALIPVGIAAGLILAIWEEKSYGKLYLAYAGILLVILTVVRLGDFSDSLSTNLIMAVHVPSGFIIMILPIYTAYSGITEKSSILYSIGGALISFGGMLLAFVAAEEPLGPFDEDAIHTILPPLLLVVGAFFTLGIALPTKWRAPIPILN